MTSAMAQVTQTNKVNMSRNAYMAPLEITGFQTTLISLKFITIDT